MEDFGASGEVGAGDRAVGVTSMGSPPCVPAYLLFSPHAVILKLPWTSPPWGKAGPTRMRP